MVTARVRSSFVCLCVCVCANFRIEGVTNNVLKLQIQTHFGSNREQ